jgi:hypothetical protein
MYYIINNWEKRIYLGKTMKSTCFESQECTIGKLVCIAGECQCCEQRAHQYIFHHWLTSKIKKKIKKWIFWITRHPFPIILVQGPHSDPLWKKYCMSIKTIISCFQYPVKSTVFTVSRKSFHTCVVFLYVVIFQQMTYFCN